MNGNARSPKGELPSRIRDAQASTGLENVQYEVVAGMVSAGTGIVVVPALVINRDSHFRRITVIHVLATLVVFLAPVISWVVDVRVMIKTLPVLVRLLIPRRAPENSTVVF